MFYVTATPQIWGTYLEAAPTDYLVNGKRTVAAWGCSGTPTGATATAIGTGKANTAMILANCSTAGIAARVAADYRGGGKSDWFLPSKDELKQMYDNRVAIDCGSYCWYWSSSEDYPNIAWQQNFGNEGQNNDYKHLTTSVRPVRAFSRTIPVTTPTTTTTTIPKTIYQWGETGPGGGIVFYDAGTTQTWGRYLEVAATDYEVNGSRAGVGWGCNGVSTGATATAIGTGKANTAMILANCTTAGIAARVAADYRGGGKSDWFLPSKDELNLMYVKKIAIGYFAADFYWSSSESLAGEAWDQYFRNGSQHSENKSYASYVRPVRAF